VFKTYFKTDRLAEKKSDFAAKKRHKKQYDANRMLCLKLDGYICQNPDCPNTGDPDDKDFTTKDSHHILGKKYDGVEYRITACRWCHNNVFKFRPKMIAILKNLRRTKPNDFRWHTALFILENNLK
jgi:hypothetical protein